MKRDRVIKLLQILKAKNITPADDWIRCSCIFAHHKHASGKDNNPSSGVSIHNSKSIYNCYSCGSSMPVDDALMELLILNKVEGIPNQNVVAALAFIGGEFNDDYVYEEEDEEEDHKLFYDYGEPWLNSFYPVTTSATAMEYLAKRKGGPVPLRVVQELDLRVDMARPYIGFPYRESKNKRVAGMRGRCFDATINSDSTLKNKWHYDYNYNKHNNTSLVWYRASELDPSKPLVVVEGEFDAARVYQQYRNVTAILTALVSAEKMSTLCQFSSVLWFSDSDKAGDISRKKARDYFESQKVDFFDLKVPEDLSDEDGKPVKDAGATPAKYMKYILREHVDLDEFIPSEPLTTGNSVE